MQAVASAYGDYTRRSLQESMTFIEKLMGVRSLDKAVEIVSKVISKLRTNSHKVCK